MTSGGIHKVQIPRWVQLVGLPLLAVLAWVLATAAAHVVFVFLVAALVALLLDPVVRLLERARLPRGLAVAIVYLSFLAALVVTIGALATVVVDQTKTAANRVDAYFTKPVGQGHQAPADRDVDRFQRWLNTHHLRQVRVEQRGHRVVDQIRRKDVGRYTSKVVTFVEGALAGYVRGQVLLSLIIGGSAGLGLWIFGATGLLPGADRYALLFGAWVAVTEVVPYVGPWIGALPPLAYALVVHPVAVLWVALLFLGVHQLEGHVVAPNVMGSALRLHPLLVIFGLLAGGEIYGLAGALVALPLLAAGRAMWEFGSERVTLERWRAGTVPVEVEVEPEEPQAEVTALKPTAAP